MLFVRVVLEAIADGPVTLAIRRWRKTPAARLDATHAPRREPVRVPRSEAAIARCATGARLAPDSLPVGRRCALLWLRRPVGNIHDA
jgi:hypothetical protein